MMVQGYMDALQMHRALTLVIQMIDAIRIQEHAIGIILSGWSDV